MGKRPVARKTCRTSTIIRISFHGQDVHLPPRLRENRVVASDSNEQSLGLKRKVLK